MIPLPEPIREVTIPEYFSPTSLVTHGGCRLRLVLSSTKRKHSKLPAGPSASIGTLIHRVIEAWEDGAIGFANASDLFDYEYEKICLELSSNIYTMRFSDLKSTQTPSRWSFTRYQAISRCLSDRRGESTAQLAAAPAEYAPEAYVGSEVELRSTSLRLRGYADRVDQVSPNRYEIRDYKTGSATDSSGQVRDEYAFQLRCYGLMLFQRVPSAEIRLIVDDGTERPVEFDDLFRQRTLDEIDARVAGLSPGAVESAVKLATPGMGCQGCGFRHQCLAYAEEAPSWWREYPQNLERVPFDSFGSITKVVEGLETAIFIVDDAQRIVKISGLGAWQGVDSSYVARRLRAFDLVATGATRDFNGRQHHPRGFHELPRDRGERRAWTAVLFSEL